ncbi:hypothetical protein M427DRAFT_76008 [Gonapodya prolifera JEL478]|uniref:L domain-like protein n=1 Tax=Gonapodya prolifera (strain JEL478) TaxID=1344416 RepID=A0A138ZX59_GONPJ|nr:hypothetical protein M427DRAFT_76008 [Gonapodya prolifera JEL478]|eukprot:KXS09086.1 hypothetical protein M427DRAFT_76008 [Gonapodya prolifera JEL478]
MADDCRPFESLFERANLSHIMTWTKGNCCTNTGAGQNVLDGPCAGPLCFGCTNGRVTAAGIWPALDFKGIVVSDFSGVSEIKSLSLGLGNVTGEVSWLANLTKLRGVSLASNRFSGTIPPLDKLVDLEWLSLQLNKFRLIELYNNNFSGNIDGLLENKANNYSFACNLGPGNPGLYTCTNTSTCYPLHQLPIDPTCPPRPPPVPAPEPTSNRSALIGGVVGGIASTPSHPGSRNSFQSATHLPSTLGATPIWFDRTREHDRMTNAQFAAHLASTGRYLTSTSSRIIHSIIVDAYARRAVVHMSYFLTPADSLAEGGEQTPHDLPTVEQDLIWLLVFTAPEEGEEVLIKHSVELIDASARVRVGITLHEETMSLL